ncbi:Interleukin-17F [Bagarius yarrelli]|uniref:Interleukin-17F n=1 Tax=Bagarius yarrelli TaxID=175774 RepID=A0A556VU66_BAGYA|nr:Interleukin-17F [Bagarius yarrelli]
MLGLTDADNNKPATCDIGLIIPKHFHTPESEKTEGNGDINNRSLSAWKWVPHTIGNRIPAVIWEAQCKSHHCTSPYSQQKVDLSSVPIYSSLLVLTQDPRNRMCFTPKFQRVAVGCTCVTKRLIP